MYFYFILINKDFYVKKGCLSKLKMSSMVFFDKYGMKECSKKALLSESGKSSENILHK